MASPMYYVTNSERGDRLHVWTVSNGTVTHVATYSIEPVSKTDAPAATFVEVSIATLKPPKPADERK